VRQLVRHCGRVIATVLSASLSDKSSKGGCTPPCLRGLNGWSGDAVEPIAEQESARQWPGSRGAVGHHAVTRSALDAAQLRRVLQHGARRLAATLCLQTWGVREAKARVSCCDIVSGHALAAGSAIVKHLVGVPD
jgi:hypothetical protein